MKVSDLAPPRGAKRKKKVVGRGHGCGHVRTSGRGSKGQKSRSGGTKAPGFEGGQTPWYRRLPKLKGFTPPSQVRYQVVNVGKLSAFEAGTRVTSELLHEKGLIRDPFSPVKILGEGELKVGLTVQANSCSAAARAKIQEAGGNIEVLE